MEGVLELGNECGGLPLWLSGKESTCQCGRCGLICISLMTTDTEHLFILLLSLYVFSFEKYLFRSSRFSSVAQLFPNLCDPTDCSTPGLSVHLQLPEFTQTHVHRVCDAIQPSHPLLSPSPPAFNLSQHHGLFR